MRKPYAAVDSIDPDLRDINDALPALMPDYQSMVAEGIIAQWPSFPDPARLVITVLIRRLSILEQRARAELIASTPAATTAENPPGGHGEPRFEVGQTSDYSTPATRLKTPERATVDAAGGNR